MARRPYAAYIPVGFGKAEREIFDFRGGVRPRGLAREYRNCLCHRRIGMSGHAEAVAKRVFGRASPPIRCLGASA